MRRTKKFASFVLAACMGVSLLVNVPAGTVSAKEPGTELIEESTKMDTATDTDAMLQEDSEIVSDESLVLVNETNFPDAEFRSFLKKFYGDSINTEKITSLDLNNTPDYRAYVVSDVTGIEKFTNLKMLSISCKPGTKVELKNNLELEELSISSENYKSNIEVDIRDNTNLQTLYAGAVKDLDISQNTNLKKLGISNGDIKTLDLSKNTMLEDVSYSGYTTRLESINVKGLKNLKKLHVFVEAGDFDTVDLSDASELEELEIGAYNKNVKTLDISHNTKLKILDVISTQIKTVDLSKLPLLQELCCNFEGSLDLSQNPELEKVNCGDLQELNVTKNTKLKSLSIDGENLKSLDLSHNTKLESLYIGPTGFDYDDVTKSVLDLDIRNIPSLWINLNYDLIKTISVDANFAGSMSCYTRSTSDQFDLSKIRGLSFNGDAYNASTKTVDYNKTDKSISYGYYQGAWEAEKNGTKTNIYLEYDREPITSEVANVDVSYRTHVQSFGWQNPVTNGVMSGTSGKAKRLEGIEISVSGNKNLGIQYSTHCQTYGWLPWSANGEMNGTTGEAKRLEAIKIQLTGADKDKYDVYYRVHAQSYGWLGWAKNGEPSGTAGYAKRLEGIQIVVVKKNEKAPGLDYAGVNASKGVHDSRAYIAKTNGTITIPGSTDSTNIMYKTHVQSFGWQNWVLNGAMSGTSGKAKRLEGINIKLSNAAYAGGIQYRTHVQTYGWEKEWKKDGAMSGTSGEAKRLEAIQIKLYGEMANHFDVYYRVHAQSYGWLGWAKNGEESGTAGFAKRLEGIQIVLVPKGSAAPANNYKGIQSVNTKAYIKK